jgi:hypothetical protein
VLVDAVARPLKNTGELVVGRQPPSLAAKLNSQKGCISAPSNEFLLRAMKSLDEVMPGAASLEPSKKGRFPTTRWSLIVNSQQRSTDNSREALASLCSTYWYPLYAYVRRQGESRPGPSKRGQQPFGSTAQGPRSWISPTCSLKASQRRND